MSDQWFYRIHGQVFGPVSLDLVRTLVLTGTIAPDDEVRSGAQSNWLLACAAEELQSTLNVTNIPFPIERRSVRDQWYCRANSGEVGPLDLPELIRLAIDGHLQPHQEIKARVDDYWRQIGSIERLIELLPFADRVGRQPVSQYGSRARLTVHRACDPADVTSADQDSRCKIGTSVTEVPQSEVDDDCCIVAFPASATKVVEPCDVIKLDEACDCEAITLESRPVRLIDRLDDNTNNATSIWTGWIHGDEFGPIDYTELLSWAVTGRLSPLDLVRSSSDGRVIPALQVPGLFSVEAAMELSLRSQHRIADLNDDQETVSEIETTETQQELQSGDSLHARTSWLSSESLVIANEKCQATTPPSTSIPVVEQGNPMCEQQKRTMRQHLADPQTIGLSAMLILATIVAVCAVGL